MGECGPGGQGSERFESGYKEERKVENNTSSQNQPNPKQFEDLGLHFDDPTDDIMDAEEREMTSQLPLENGRERGRWK